MESQGGTVGPQGGTSGSQWSHKGVPSDHKGVQQGHMEVEWRLRCKRGVCQACFTSLDIEWVSNTANIKYARGKPFRVPE